MGSGFPSPDRRLLRAVAADLSPMFEDLPLVVATGREAPSVIVLAPATAAAPVRRAGAALAGVALAALFGAALIPGFLRDASIAPPHPVAAQAPSVVESPPAEVAEARRVALTPARYDIVASQRPHRAAKPSGRAAPAPRRFDWSVYERETRPQFRDAAGAATPDGLY